MDKRRRWYSLAIAAAVVVGAGTAFAFAAADDDEPLRGSTYDRAVEAALQEVGQGTVVETEEGDDGAAYGVEVRLEDGSVIEVELNDEFEVVGTEQDDDGSEEEGDDD